jgi:hypothetical protein
MKVSVRKKGYGIEFENGKSLENNGNKKRDNPKGTYLW